MTSTGPVLPTDAGDTLDARVCWRLLAEAPLGRLAALVRHEPLVYPVHHVVEDGTVAFRLQASDTLLGVTAHPRVAFEVDEIDAASRCGWSVLVKGDAEISYEPPTGTGPRAALRSTWLVRIHPTEVTGRTVSLPRPGAAGPGPGPAR